MKNCILAFAATAVVVLGMTSGAAAQSSAPQTTNMPTWEFSAGYQALFVTDDPGTTFPFGLAVDGVRNFGPFGIVGEGGWAIRSDGDDPDTILTNRWHLGGGFRWSGRKHPRVWPYAQVLAGVAVHNSSGDVGGIDIGDTSSHFMIQPGGGVTFVVGDGWGIVGAVDYRRVFLDEATTGTTGVNEIRVFAGFRMILD